MVTKIVGHFGTADAKSSSNSSAIAVKMANDLADRYEAERNKPVRVIRVNPPER